MMRGLRQNPCRRFPGKPIRAEYAAPRVHFHQIGIKERENPALPANAPAASLPEIYDGISVRFQPFKFG